MQNLPVRVIYAAACRFSTNPVVVVQERSSTHYSPAFNSLPGSSLNLGDHFSYDIQRLLDMGAGYIKMGDRTNTRSPYS